jgi:hypothetical protein
MNKSHLLGAVCACFVLCLPGLANAALLDFETVPMGTPSDQLDISTQYEATYGVTFSLVGGGTPTLEKTGGSDDGHGFLNFQTGTATPDVETAGYEGQLGDYYLRIGTDELLSAPIPNLLISYTNPVSAASAQIWDIDGGPAGTEQWLVTALDSGGSVIDSLLSPLGTAQGAGTLDGIPWTWSFSHANNDIYAIELAFIGNKTTSLGLAFDNFSPSTAAVPIPAAAWLFGSGLLGLAGMARRKKA